MIAQQLGLTLTEIRALLVDLPDGRTPTKRDWAKFSKTFQTRLDEQIAQLTLLREKLDGCIGCGCLSLKQCAIYNPQDAMAKNGAGPRNVLPR